MTWTWHAAPPPVVAPGELPPRPGTGRVKVLHVITKFWAGAGGNTLVTALGMDPARYEVWVAGCEGGPLWARAEAAGIRTVQLRHFRETIAPLRDVSVLFQLIRLIRRERFTIVHSHSSKGGVLGRVAAWLCRTPVIVHTFHGFSFHDYMSARRRRLYLLMERMVRPLTDQVLTVAPAVAREAVEQRLARPGRIAVVPSAVELDRVPRQADHSVRRELGIPDDVPLVGTVGRLDFQKAPMDFVRMAARVHRDRPEVRFVMVGDGALEREARDAAAAAGIPILFTGFRGDAARVASAFDVFVVSSLYEGLGRSLTEALASGRPVAATAVNGVPDLVEHGSTGLLAPPRDPEAMSRAVVWLLDHPAEARTMGANGRDRVRAQFRPELMCGLVDRVYGHLLGLPAPAEPVSRVPPLNTVGSIERSDGHAPPPGAGGEPARSSRPAGSVAHG
ncbi:MAG: glycosyltransferase family 4 protein [Actinomycetota bacterium]